MDPILVCGVVTSLLVSGLHHQLFTDRSVYEVPTLTYSGGDRERPQLKRILEEPPRNPLPIAVDYAPRGKVRVMEGYYVASFTTPAEGARPGAYAPSFKNVYDDRGRIVEKYEYYSGDARVEVERYYRYAWNERNQLLEYQCYDAEGGMEGWRKFAYDGAGRLLEEDILPGESSKARQAYSPEGMLLSRSILIEGSYRPEYEAGYRGRLLDWERAYIPRYRELKDQVSYRYDAAGRLVEFHYRQTEPPADAQKELISYDGAGRVAQIDHFDKWSAEELYLTERLRYRYEGERWTEESHHDAEGVLTKNVKRSHDAAGRLTRQDSFYPGEAEGGPYQSYTARYDGSGRLVEEGLWEFDSSAGKLRQSRKLLLGWTGDGRLRTWESWEVFGSGLGVSERRTYAYDGEGNLVRDECWNRDGSTGKLYLNWAYVYRYDGKAPKSALREGFPFMSNDPGYRCLGPWTAETTGDDPAYRFKR